MKKYIIHIKLLLLFILVVFLYGFASHRKSKKKSNKYDVVFENGNNLFISYEMVNKLLIQKLDTDKNQSKENINLDSLENFIQSNKMVENTEVFLKINGDLGVIIKQRTPVLRVANNSKSYYFDRLGEKMPLSENYSARVPVSSSEFDEENSKDIILLANYIKEDEFFKKQIIGISQKKSTNQFELKTRIGDQVIEFGNLNHMQSKFNKLKVFYQKVIADSTLSNYKTIDLKYKNQVVCTKK
jgi:cell division protein FtsQ